MSPERLSEYKRWITTHYPNSRSAHCECSTATTKMTKAFPELIRARGWYGSTQHWWCKTEDGTIVDPTRIQFSYRAEYVEFREGVDREPIGKCMICGSYCWKGESPDNNACSPECLRELAREYGIVL